MRTKSGLPVILLGITCAILAVSAFSLYQHSRFIGQTLQRKQDEFIAKIAEYKKNMEQLQEQLDRKIRALSDAENRLTEFESQIDTVKAGRAELEEEARGLKETNEDLRKKLGKFTDVSLESLITDTLDKEENPDIKRVLADALAKVELMRAGKPVDLERIIVTQPGGAGSKRPAASAGEPTLAIVALDRKNRLVAINGGRKDNIGVGARLSIVRDGTELATAEVVAVRYRVASAFVGSISRSHSFNDIKEGDGVIVTGTE